MVPTAFPDYCAEITPKNPSKLVNHEPQALSSLYSYTVNP